MKWTNKGHEFDDIGYLLKDKKQVFIYGAGDIGLEIFDLLKALNKWIKWDIYLVDRDEHKQQIGYKGNRILSPNQFFDINNNSNKDDYFVVIAAMSNGYREIYNNLVNNLGEDVTNFEGSYFLHRYLSIYFIYRYNMVFFESENMLISSVCNIILKSYCSLFTISYTLLISSLEVNKTNVLPSVILINSETLLAILFK